MRVTLHHIRPEAGNATTFVFEPSEPFTWRAGQSVKIAVPGAYGPIEHRFTISSAPTERHIAITTRPSDSEYKQSLFNLALGDIIDAFALEGSFTWRDTNLRPVFVAAGIGITPFRSIIKERVAAGRPIAGTLIYGAPADGIIFKNELDQCAAANPAFTVHYVVGSRLDAPRVLKYAHATGSLFYISGPSAMVDDLSTGLITLGVTKSQLVRDWFTGHLPQAG